LAKHIERLADHATNIAEDVVFMLDAKVIAHGNQVSETIEPEDIMEHRFNLI